MEDQLAAEAQEAASSSFPAQRIDAGARQEWKWTKKSSQEEQWSYFRLVVGEGIGRLEVSVKESLGSEGVQVFLRSGGRKPSRELCGSHSISPKPGMGREGTHHIVVEDPDAAEWHIGIFYLPGYEGITSVLAEVSSSVGMDEVPTAL